MRAFALSLVAVAAVAAVPSLHAQGPLAEPPVERAAAPALPADAMTAAADAPVAVTVRRKAAHTGVTAFAGLLIGASAGFLASQVIWSDWDKTTDGEFMGRRLGFAAGGSALGLLGGLVVAHSATPSIQAPPMGNGRSHRLALTPEELRRSTAVTVYELLQALRPEWLQGRGPGAVRAGAVPNSSARAGGGSAPDPSDHTTGTALGASDPNDRASASTAPRVYVDTGLLGDIFTLRELTVHQVQSLEYLNEAEATYRFGPGNQSGVIWVHSGQW